MRLSRTIGRSRLHAQAARISIMLYYAIILFVVAIIAAIFDFSGIAAGAAGIALFLPAAGLAVVLGLVKRPAGPEAAR